MRSALRVAAACAALFATLILVPTAGAAVTVAARSTLRRTSSARKAVTFRSGSIDAGGADKYRPTTPANSGPRQRRTDPCEKSRGVCRQSAQILPDSADNAAVDGAATSWRSKP